jgi:hypothetical protein
MERDIFICHASEDNAEVIEPLVAALDKEEITCWVDEGEIRWGDSITQKVNEGLRISRFVMVVLSEAFLEKHWPRRELYAVLNLEAASGEVKVLPLLVGGESVRQGILAEFPLLNDKRYEIWDGTPDSVVDAALTRLSRTRTTISGSEEAWQADGSAHEIPLPKLRKRFSQRDRDLFLKETFTFFKDYFRRALSQLDTRYPDVETDFTEIHAQKFIAKIYLGGEIKNQCKIWIGGLSASDGIGYLENRFNVDIDNSLNELVTVVDDGFDLRLRFMLGDVSLFSPEEAAERLWRRFSSPLERL